jgi:hypothetical protein
MKKSLFTAFAVGLCITANLMAQVPSYVPTNGLVGWWPFNGNANDESGNGNNGTVNGATLTTDRFGNANKAYSFSSSISNYISANLNSMTNGNSITVCGWYRASTPNKYYPRLFYYGEYPVNGSLNQFDMISGGIAGNEPSWINTYTGKFYAESNISNSAVFDQNVTSDNQWHAFSAVFDTQLSQIRIYVDGIFISSAILGQNSINSNTLYIGRDPGDSFGGCNTCGRFNGIIDDIGIWNRALTAQEISDLYNAVNCTNDLTISPSVNSLQTGNTANFTATTSDANATFVWQSDFGQGFVTLNDYGNYSGTNTNVLSISNVQLANHNQPIRAISSNTNCTDTSNVATIQIADTCITTIYDTLYTTVTDTLIINTTLSLPAPNNENTILIYPNPASDHITIDNGNYAAMSGYTIKIQNNAGQQVFQSAINQQQFYVDLSTWSGNGLYFVHLIDPQNNTVTVRKIVLQ